MKIYTKTGDKGETGVVGGRIKKDSTIINTIGTFDELNASLGIIVAHKDLLQASDYKELIKTQNLIFFIGSIISGTDLSTDFEKHIKELEQNIDQMNLKLEELTKFILPGGSVISSYIHLSRTICRRAERELILYINTYTSEKPSQMNVNTKKLADIQKYINRLSDYLFVLARFENKQHGVEDTYWNKIID